MQLKRRVHNPQTPQATRKQLQTGQNHVKAESEHRLSKRRPNFTVGAEVEVLLQNVDVSIQFHYGYICQDPALFVLGLSILSRASCVCVFYAMCFPVFVYYFHVLLCCRSELRKDFNRKHSVPPKKTPGGVR